MTEYWPRQYQVSVSFPHVGWKRKQFSSIYSLFSHGQQSTYNGNCFIEILCKGFMTEIGWHLKLSLLEKNFVINFLIVFLCRKAI